MPTFSPFSGSPRNISPSLEQYVEAIAHLLTQGKVCSVSGIAAEVQVSRPAVSRAIRELSEQEIVTHESYGYVDLTAKGQSIADRLTARHESILRFMTEILNFDSEWADQEACRLEHQLDDEFVARMSELAEFFETDAPSADAWRERLTEFLRRRPI